MASQIITPRILKGFRDHLPLITLQRNKMINSLEKTFAAFGFAPIDTPALEYAEILLGKGSEDTDKQLYRFEDNGKRDVALRFDLTVPLARFAAMHIGELGTPFKRYHIAPVWRAEKPQRGRYREFIQCDFDIIGTLSTHADAEIGAVIHESMAALNISHKICMNNRRVINGFLESIAVEENSRYVLRAIDKLEKLGRETVEAELSDNAKLDSEQINSVFSFLSLSRDIDDSSKLLTELRSFLKSSEQALEGVEQLSTIIDDFSTLDISNSDYTVDLSIARGLDYYTGTVFETTCNDLPEIGSICSGGRYDNLASLYTRQELPGVGASIGLDRILAALETLGRLGHRTTSTEVLVAVLDEELRGRYNEIAHRLRSSGIPAELFLENKRLGQQIKYADKKGVPFVVIAGSTELNKNSCLIKILATGVQTDLIHLDDLPAEIELLKLTINQWD